MGSLDDVVELIGALDADHAVVGIGGAVAVGKSTLAGELARRLATTQRTVALLSTDSFLLPNTVLDARGHSMRKGFPETYDTDLIRSALDALRQGGRIELPVYSHLTYDIVPGERLTVGPADVVLLEGVIALQEPAVSFLDLGIYLDADVDVNRRWFIERFMRLIDAAKTDEALVFYREMSALPAETVAAIAEGAWDAINAVNLREHIAPSATNADVVITKGDDHSLIEVRTG